MAILRSLLQQPPKVVQPKRKRTVVKVKVKKGWSVGKWVFTCCYLIGCSVLDIQLFPLLSWGIIGVIGVEVAILFGFPKLSEWLRAP